MVRRKRAVVTGEASLKRRGWARLDSDLVLLLDHRLDPRPDPGEEPCHDRVRDFAGGLIAEGVHLPVEEFEVATAASRKIF